jgi:hypothetical protein
MVQGPLLLPEAGISQRQQGRQVGKRHVEAVRELDTRGEFRQLEWFLQFIEHDCFFDDCRNLKELNPKAVWPQIAIDASDSNAGLLTYVQLAQRSH